MGDEALRAIVHLDRIRSKRIPPGGCESILKFDEPPSNIKLSPGVRWPQTNSELDIDEHAFDDTLVISISWLRL